MLSGVLAAAGLYVVHARARALDAHAEKTHAARAPRCFFYIHADDSPNGPV